MLITIKREKRGARACFDATAVYSYPPFTQLTKFSSNKIVEFLQFFMENWHENILKT